MELKTNKYLIVALLIGIVFHVGSMAFTLEGTYDAFIHAFFAEHYATQWFEPWNESWYTGFTVMGYPPLVHQVMALFSMIGGLKFSLYAVSFICIILFVTGVFRFSLLITQNRRIAGYGAILAVFSSSFIETLHLFGQLPSIVGISVLMHALPEIYAWLKTGKYRSLISSFSLLAVTVTSHHVTPIFGMIFFIFPVIGMVLMDITKEKAGSYGNIRLGIFLKVFIQNIRNILIFGFGALLLIVICILPYWVNTKNNPITQVPIPHGSRDNFLEISSSGMVFFLIPWGVLLLFIPYIFYRYFSRRYLFFGLSIALLTLLGTGGTTPIPRMLLGDNAFNILTLDRFTLWATIMALPIFGEFIYQFSEGNLKVFIQNRWGALRHRISGGIIAGLIIFIAVFSINLSNFRPSQPQRIDMVPIVNFLNQDQHDHWRYLTLGFGDQMAWLSAQTKATSIDGNYHSARRLPELTSRAVERLENSKFRGIEGLGSLQQFLTVPEKYHLKYVFSNDKFYDPLLYFLGWHRLPHLENGITVWERAGVPPLPKVMEKAYTPTYLKLMWGVIPLLTLIFAIFISIRNGWGRILKTPQYILSYNETEKEQGQVFNTKLLSTQSVWILSLGLISIIGLYQFYKKNSPQLLPENVIKAYHDALDFKEFEKAYSYLHPLSDKSLDQYMLEISVSDGLLSSYAKLETIHISNVQINDDTANVEVTTHWITPLKKIERTETIETIMYDGKWFIVPKKTDLDIPPDQLIKENRTIFYNHGRRRISSEKTYHEDIIRQPTVEIEGARLIKFQGKYAIVGRVQNIDRMPADISITGTLYNADNKSLASFNAKDILKHKLMPMETSEFRIDFESIAWSMNEETIPSTFNPKEFTPKQFNETPSYFGIEVTANLATVDLQNQLAILETTIQGNSLMGQLFNSTSSNATVPQLFISYYDIDKKLIFVENHYLEESIRPQRSLSFETPLIPQLDCKVLNGNGDLIYVNGSPNKKSARKMLEDRIPRSGEELIAINANGYSYISIRTNNYIGNPN